MVEGLQGDEALISAGWQKVRAGLAGAHQGGGACAMTLSDICIRRPVFATVLSLIVVLLGLMAYDRLAVREYPNIDVPIVTVNVTYPGASPEIMESQVAQPIEDVLSGIEGLDFVSSISRCGKHPDHRAVSPRQ